MWTKKFWFDAIERAVRTAAQLALTTGAFDAIGKDLSVTWKTHLSMALTAAAGSIVMSLAGSQTGSKQDTGSLVT